MARDCYKTWRKWNLNSPLLRLVEGNNHTHTHKKKKRNLTRNRNFSLFLFFLWMCWMSFGARPSCTAHVSKDVQTYSDSMNEGAGSSGAIVYWNVNCFDYLNPSFLKKSCLSKNG
ncbi:hypothetical protein DAPPUDRAFT_302928 [Daphnia pulex]|uniref:Uncharacterized protein n=1 Tax=Daphnia pulex TaxID=6669 RepID=E9HQ32_DAPPU|nr:hypothetical protein DAPPUDRAFT_302928 [Daphnia pulex]|eukprot:EFX66129.1 hypothetical protein DAPPUDRAFT_302928 [Daphnia pulex]